MGMRGVKKLLFNPFSEDLKKHSEEIKEMTVCKNWKEVSDILLKSI